MWEERNEQGLNKQNLAQEIETFHLACVSITCHGLNKQNLAQEIETERLRNPDDG